MTDTNALADGQAETTISERVQRFWNLLETEHVRIVVDLRREIAHGAPDGPTVYWDCSTFSNDVAKELVALRATPVVPDAGPFEQSIYHQTKLARDAAFAQGCICQSCVARRTSAGAGTKAVVPGVERAKDVLMGELFKASDHGIIAHNTVHELRSYISRAILSLFPVQLEKSGQERRQIESSRFLDGSNAELGGEIPDCFYWILAKGKLKSNEPLYAIQLLNRVDRSIVVEIEDDDLAKCISRAVNVAKQLPCPACEQSSPLPGGNCSDCMNTGLAYPQANAETDASDNGRSTPPAVFSDSENPTTPWRTDMENAPRDGTEIVLGWFDPMQGIGRDVCSWNLVSERWFNSHGPLTRHRAYQPTHWMPLPEPPK